MVLNHLKCCKLKQQLRLLLELKLVLIIESVFKTGASKKLEPAAARVSMSTYSEAETESRGKISNSLAGRPPSHASRERLSMQKH